jgi:hypothetical protein
MPFLAGGLVGDGEDDRHLRVLAGGDELLDAVEDEMIAIAVGAGGDRRRIGTGMRFGQAEAAEHLAARQWFEPGFLLFVAAVLHGDAAGQRVLHADDGRGGAVAGGDLFDHQHQRHVVHAGAAPLLGNDHAERTEFAEFAQGLGRERCDGGPTRRRRAPGAPARNRAASRGSFPVPVSGSCDSRIFSPC